jgi:hypothetical protein
VGEVLLKDNFPTQSASGIHRKLQKSVTEGEKSLDQLMQLAMSVSYNWDITKKREKDKKDTMTSLQLLGSAPPDWGLHPKLATIVGMKGTSAENAQKGDSQEDSPNPQLGPCPLCKGNHWRSKSPVSRWKGGCHLLWIVGSWGLLSRLHFLVLMLRSLG